MITDRNDLDDQLFDTFAAGRALLRQAPVQAPSREQLKVLLDRAAGGVVFTTIQKFAEAHGVISERSNVVVMADEAHRSQYGFVEGGARWMREALPNATFVGFTGTPQKRGFYCGVFPHSLQNERSVASAFIWPFFFEHTQPVLSAMRLSSEYVHESTQKPIKGQVQRPRPSLQIIK